MTRIHAKMKINGDLFCISLGLHYLSPLVTIGCTSDMKINGFAFHSVCTIFADGIQKNDRYAES